MTKKIGCLNAIGIALLLLVIFLPLQILLSGLVISKFWSWFIAPVFILNPLSIVNAIGFGFFIGLFTLDLARKIDIKDPDYERSEGQKIASIIIGAFLSWGLLLGLGYIMHVLLPATPL